jgi:hypothetical protein
LEDPAELELEPHPANATETPAAAANRRKRFIKSLPFELTLGATDGPFGRATCYPHTVSPDPIDRLRSTPCDCIPHNT